MALEYFFDASATAAPFARLLLSVGQLRASRRRRPARYSLAYDTARDDFARYTSPPFFTMMMMPQRAGGGAPRAVTMPVLLPPDAGFGRLADDEMIACDMIFATQVASPPKSINAQLSTQALYSRGQLEWRGTA